VLINLDRLKMEILWQCRINVKDNILKVNQIFAHGYGFRANIDILQPPKAHRFGHKHKVSRREIFSTFEQLMTQ
jgi:hypothetical protein